MGKGFWIGAVIGLTVAVIVSVSLVSLFELRGIWPVVVGFASGVIFTNIGIGVGTALED